MPAEALLLFCTVLLLFGTRTNSQEIYIRSVVDDSSISESRVDSSDPRFPILEPEMMAEHAVVVPAGNRISYERSAPAFDGVLGIGNTRLFLRTVKGSHGNVVSRLNRKTSPGLPDDASSGQHLIFALQIGGERAAFEPLTLRLKDFDDEGNEERDQINANKIADLWAGVLHNKISSSVLWERLQWDMIRSSEESDLIKQQQVDQFWADQFPKLISFQLQDGTDPLKCSNLRLPSYSGLKHSHAVYLCKPASTLQSAINFFRSHPDFFLNAAFLFLLVALTASALYLTMD